MDGKPLLGKGVATVSAFYNEIDAYPAQWMRNLIDAGHIAPGVVDERSIVDLQAEDLAGYDQCHFFAGIGVWSHALRLAGWADDARVWTGSCPCQPFSAAGKGLGHADERHLWPAWFRLIEECRPPVVFGEQVASASGRDWLAAVRADLEGAGYAVGCADLCAAGAGAPHIRQRSFFVAYDANDGRARVQGTWQRGAGAAYDGATGELGNANGAGRRARDGQSVRGEARPAQPADSGAHGLVEHPAGDGRGARRAEPDWRVAAERCGDGLVAGAQRERGRGGQSGIEDAADARAPGEAGRPGGAGFWSDAEWVWCRDGVWRPHGPESFPLTVAHGASGRVGRLRAYGNAIVAPLAAEFIASFMECWGRVVRP